MTTTSYKNFDIPIKTERMEQPVILLSIHNPENRKLIHRFLPDHFSVVDADNKIEADSFDLCIVDEQSISLNQKILRQKKRETAPVFLPIMLLSRRNSSLNRASHVWDFVDDMLSMPVPTGVFNSRIDLLLQSRTYSLALEQKNKRLQEERDKFQLIAENSTDMISQHAPDGTYLYVSPSSKQLLGYTPEELEGKNAYKLLHPDDTPDISEKHQLFSKKHDIASVAYRIQTKEGKYKWVETTSRTIWDSSSDKLVEIQASTRDISERVEYQQQLEEERNLFRKLAESSPVGITIIDETGQISFANKQAEEILGISKDEIAGRTYDDPKWEITDLGGDPFPEEKLPFHQVYTSGQPVYDVQHAIKWPNGKQKLLSINAVPLVDNEDNIQGVIASVIDITEKKEQDRKLREEQEFVRAAIENQPGIFFLVSEDMDFVLWNNALEKELGYSSKEIENMHPLQFFEEEDHPFIQTKIKQILDAGRADIEAKIISKSGKSVHYYLIGSRLEREEGTFIIGSAVNIDERVKAEQKLRESEKRWEELVEMNPSLVQITDDDNIIKYLNPAGARLYGFEKPDELIGKPFINFVDFGDEQLLGSRMKRILDDKESVPPVTYHVTTWDGEERVVELQGVPLELEDETVILTIGKDITEHHNYEERLKQSLDEKETLLQEIHHRVKNNLAIVSGLLELQGNEIKDPGLQEVLDKSQMRIHSIAKVHELLYQHEELNRIDFQDYIRQLTDTMDQVSSSQKHKITYEYDLEPVLLTIDQAIPCGMVINELITNSIKHAFGNRSGGTISLQMSEEENEVFIKISDDGIGLPDSFHFMEQNTLGTTIVKMLVQQLRANFKFYNNETTGSSFELSFEKRGYSGPAKQVE